MDSRLVAAVLGLLLCGLAGTLETIPERGELPAAEAGSCDQPRLGGPGEAERSSSAGSFSSLASGSGALDAVPPDAAFARPASSAGLADSAARRAAGDPPSTPACPRAPSCRA